MAEDRKSLLAGSLRGADETRPVIHEGGLMNSNLSFGGRVPSSLKGGKPMPATCLFSTHETRPLFMRMAS